MRAVNRDYTFWLAGYYDDFTNARSVPDDDNLATVTSTYTHASTHHGSPMSGEALLNPRFRYSYPDRAQDAGYLGDDTVTAERPVLLATSALAQTHNKGIHQWLTLNPEEQFPSRWEGRAQLQYPCSLIANRQKFNRSTTLDTYLAFSNGNDTSGTYYAWAGETDATDGRSWTIDHSATNPGATTKYLPYAGVTQQSNFRQDKKRLLTSLTGTYMAERQTQYIADADYSVEHLKPIKSPAGKPFLVSQIYSPTASTDTLLSYDGNLNCKGITDTFTMRMAWNKMSDASLTDYHLNIGFDNSDGALTFNKSTHAFSRTASAISLTFNPVADFGSAPLKWSEWTNDIQTVIDNDDIWYDIDIVLDFSVQQYTAYYNGIAFASNVPFNSKPTGGSWSPTDFYGWSLDMEYTIGSDGFIDMATLIDRVGVVVPLSDAVHVTGERVPVLDFNYKTVSNGISSFSVTIADDDDDLTITPLVTGNTLSEWWLIAFRDTINRPFWRGPIERINHKQNNSTRIAESQIVARDALSILHSQLPIWEQGQGSTLSLSQHASIGTGVEKRIGEITAMTEVFNFGKAKLKTTESTVGYDIDRFSSYSEVTNQRTSLYSAHPIQVYNDEDTDGPNRIEDEWEGRGSTFKLQDTIAIQAFNSGGFDYMQVFHSDQDLAVSDSVSIKGTTEDGTYTVLDVDNTLSNNNAIDDLRMTIIRTTSGALSSAYGSATGKRFVQFEDVDTVGQNSGKTVVLATIASPSTHSFSVGDQLVNIGVASTGPYATNRGGEELWKLGEYVTVTAVPNNTTLMFEIDNWPYTVATVSVSGGQINDGCYVGDPTHWGGSSATLQPPVPARIFIDGLLSDTTFQTVKNRNLHSRWVRDLTRSPFFKAKFGIISANPFYATGNETALWKPVSGTVATNRSWGANAVWNGNAAFTSSATSFTVDEPGLYYNWPRDGSTAILDIVDNDTGEHDTLYATTISTPSSKTSTYDFGNDHFACTAHGRAIYDIVVHEGFNNVRLNGIFQICDVPTANAYDAIRLGDNPFVGQDQQSKLNAYIHSNSQTYSSSIDPDGIYPLYTIGAISGQTQHNISLPNSDSYRKGTMPTGHKAPQNADDGTMYFGSVTISGVKGQTRDWPQGSRLYHRRIDESNGYKHIWVLWADMRNNGNADADGGYRKSTFGTLLPTNSNYEINLLFADQYDSSGSLDRYTSLKIGEDCDIWELDAENEPFTGSAWAAQDGASNDEDLDTRYASWETLGGSFMLIDTSPFWNLNTSANNGRPGYASGGRTDLGDYDTEHRGFPYLLDAYWREGTASYKNTAATVDDHANSLNWINDGSLLAVNITVGDTDIYIHDKTQFDTSGYGAILLERGSGRNAEKQIVYIRWTGTGTDTTGDKLTGALVSDYENPGGPSSIRTLLDTDIAAGLTGSQLLIQIRDPITKLPEIGWDAITVYNTPAAIYSLRLMMTVEGYIESPNIGTYFEHDKLRMLLNCCMQKSWMRNGTLSCITDIANTPISEKMTTTGLTYDHDLLGTGEGDMESYGSSSDGNSSILSIIQAAQSSSGVGRDFAQTDIFTYQIGPDNRVELRPTYPLYGKTFDRTTLKVSNLSSNLSGQINIVRVYFNNSTSFIDHPTPTADTSQRFKVLHYPSVKNRDEALNIAKEEFAKISNAQTSVSAELIRDSTADDFNANSLMHRTARNGYISDPCIHTMHEDSGATGYGKQGASWWTARFGGCLHPGMINAIDSHDDALQPTATVRPVLKAEDSTTTIGGVYPGSVGNITLGTQDGLLSLVVSGAARNLTWSPDLSVDASNQTIDVAAGGWFDFSVVQSAVTKTMSVFVVAADLPSSGTTNMSIWYADMQANDDWYNWWGSNSISHALQVVSIEDSMPVLSETSTNELRVAITLETDNSGDTGYTTPSDIEDAVWRIWLLDYSFSTAVGPLPSATGQASPQYTATLSGNSSILARGNGFYTIDVPSSYSSTTRKIVISFNAEYCKAILRNRHTGTFANANNIQGITSGTGFYTTTNTSSLFPLGQRDRVEMQALSHRRAWYAPRINIEKDDLSFRPSTTMTLTDSHLDLSSEPMVIRGINWRQQGREHETVTFDLERFANQYRYSLANFLKQVAPPGNAPPGPRPPSGPTPQNPPGGGGWGNWNHPAFPQVNQPVGSSPKSVKMPRSPIGGGDGTSSIGGIGVNDLSVTNSRVVRGRMDSPGDTTASGGTWGVLGQKKVGPASSANRSIDGVDSIPTPSDGEALLTAEGFVLPGVNDPEVGVNGEKHIVTYDMRIPNDISDSLLNITALISYDTITGGGDAELTVKAEVLETTNSISQTITITQGSSRKTHTLLQPSTLQGIGTDGNTLRVTITRTPGQGNDAGPYQSVRVHNLSVKPRRYTQPTAGATDVFKPY